MAVRVIGSGQTYSGHATFYTQGGQKGACGDLHKDSDLVVAMNFHKYGPDDKKSSTCGRYVVITRVSSGATVRAMVADDCPSCDGESSIDLSVAAFNKIAKPVEGEVDITWQYE